MDKMRENRLEFLEHVVAKQEVVTARAVIKWWIKDEEKDGKRDA